MRMFNVRRFSARTLTTPSAFSTTPLISSAELDRATRRNRRHRPSVHTTLTMPVSSSMFMNVTPAAVAGRWRWVTAPPISTRVPLATLASSAVGMTPSSLSSSRMNSVGKLSGDSPVAHTSAAAVSRPFMPGRVGALVPTLVPGSRFRSILMMM